MPRTPGRASGFNSRQLHTSGGGQDESRRVCLTRLWDKQVGAIQKSTDNPTILAVPASGWNLQNGIGWL